MSLSADGLSLFFGSNRERIGTAYEGYIDIYMSKRPAKNDPWGMPVKLGPTINPGLQYDNDCPSISADGKVLFFFSNRPGGIEGSWDLWLSRQTVDGNEWGVPVNLGPTVNDSYDDMNPYISPDGSTLFFISERPGGLGELDIWQASVKPIVDFNADGILDLVDMVMLIDHWETDNPLYDIGPMLWGDGVVDREDLKVFITYWEEQDVLDSTDDSTDTE